MQLKSTKISYTSEQWGREGQTYDWGCGLPDSLYHLPWNRPYAASGEVKQSCVYVRTWSGRSAETVPARDASSSASVDRAAARRCRWRPARRRASWSGRTHSGRGRRPGTRRPRSDRRDPRTVVAREPSRPRHSAVTILHHHDTLWQARRLGTHCQSI